VWCLHTALSQQVVFRIHHSSKAGNPVNITEGQADRAVQVGSTTCVDAGVSVHALPQLNGR